MILFFSKFFKNFIFKSWWVFSFLLFCGVVYEQKLKKRKEEYAHFYNQYVVLQNEKKIALFQQEQLLMQLNSQNDLSWKELILMRELGLVPEEHKKIFFKNSQN